MIAADIKKRFDHLVTQRKTLDDTLQAIERFVVPHRGEFFRPMQTEHEVDWRRREIYDSTAVDACEMLASSLQGSLTSPSTIWFNVIFRTDELNEDQEAREWLEQCRLRIYQALLDSNFNLESAEFYLDLVSFGTSILFEEAQNDDPKQWEGIDFQAAPVRDCYFEMGHKNQVINYYRRFTWTPLQIIDKFGDKTPQSVKDKAKNPNSNDNRMDVIFCVFERKNKAHNLNAVDNNGQPIILAPVERAFGWKWVMHEGGEQLGNEGGYYENPVFVARFRKTSGSQWGYSPAHIALSDILTLNALTEETLEALGKVVDPSTIVTSRNLISDLDLGRGGLTVVTDIEGIKPYESRARFDIGELRIDRLQSSINRAFRVDQLQLKDSPAMTATEANIRYELMNRLLGPALGRLQADYLDPLIIRTFYILRRAGKLPAMPDIVRELQGEFDVQYVGPLPRAQRQEVVQSTNQWLANNLALIEVKPEILDIPDFDMIARDTAQMAGLPAKYLNSTSKVKTIRQEREQAEQRMQEAAIAQQEGEAMQAQGQGQASLNEAEQPGELNVNAG